LESGGSSNSQGRADEGGKNAAHIERLVVDTEREPIE
jgi:hypothetical protein